MSDERLIASLTEMARVYEGKHVSIERIGAYANRLSDLPIDDVVDAIDRLINTSRFFPTIAEIREAAVAGQPIEGLAEMAWREVEEQALKVGFNPQPIWHNGAFHDPEKPVFTSPITEAAVKSLGWKNICHTDEPSERAFLRNQFIKTWAAYSTRTLKQAQNGDAIDIGSGAGTPVSIGELARRAALKTGSR